MALQVQRHEDDGEVRLLITGEVDLTTASRLERELLRAESGGKGLTLDLSKVEFFDSTGLQILLDADTRAAQNGHRLVVVTGAGEAARVIDLTRVAERMTAAVIK